MALDTLSLSGANGSAGMLRKKKILRPLISFRSGTPSTSSCRFDFSCSTGATWAAFGASGVALGPLILKYIPEGAWRSFFGSGLKGGLGSEVGSEVAAAIAGIAFGAKDVSNTLGVPFC